MIYFSVRENTVIGIKIINTYFTVCTWTFSKIIVIAYLYSNIIIIARTGSL